MRKRENRQVMGLTFLFIVCALFVALTILLFLALNNLTDHHLMALIATTLLVHVFIKVKKE